MADKEGNEFKVDGKQEMMDDLLKAFEGGLDDNITLICSDGVRVSSNKSVLAIRSPFFASMFLGGFQNTVGEELEFNSCDSVIMKLVLKYLWSGEVTLTDLQTAKLLCRTYGNIPFFVP